MEHIEEQTVLITGATDGLGREVAKELAAKGATVLLHGRDADRAEAAVREIEDETGSDKLSYYLADLSSVQEVRGLAGKVRAEHDRLDVLINNAGVILPERRENEDGVELTLAVNYLSHFLGLSGAFGATSLMLFALALVPGAALNQRARKIVA